MQINEQVLEKTVQRCRERGIVVPTFAQQKDPATIPDSIKQRLSGVGLWDVDPLNLFRITWKNEPVETGGGFNDGNWIEFPPELTGVPARIAQGRRGLRLSRAAPGHRAIRSDQPESRLAEHGEFLSWWCV